MKTTSALLPIEMKSYLIMFLKHSSFGCNCRNQFLKLNCDEARKHSKFNTVSFLGQANPLHLPVLHFPPAVARLQTSPDKSRFLLHEMNCLMCFFGGLDASCNGGVGVLTFIYQCGCVSFQKGQKMFLQQINHIQSYYMRSCHGASVQLSLSVI